MRQLIFITTIFCLVLAVVWQASWGQQPEGLRFTRRTLMHDLNEGCAIGDINRDGKPDVVAGTHWYAAPNFVPRPVRDIPVFSGDYYSSNGDHLYDVDGDGWLDVISGGWMDPNIYWYKNPGELGLRRAYKWEQKLLKTTRGQNEKFELRDIDGDGVPELYVNCWDKKAPVVVWRLMKKPDGTPDLEQVVIGEQGGGHGYAWGDINGDSLEDLCVETGWYERPAGNPLAKPWKFRPETALPHPSVPFLVVDLNGDGRNDLIWGKAHDYGLFWWEQGPPKADGTTTWTQHVIDTSWSQVHCLVWADLDGDGQGELITGKRVRAHATGDPGGEDPECLFYYKWDRERLQFTRYPISDFGGGVGSGMQICVADLNQDGRPDVAVAGKSGTYILFNEGPAR